MLKLPKVTSETIGEMNKRAGAEKEKGVMMQEIMKEFASEQPVLVSMFAAFTVPLPPMYAACLVWEALRIECENSELESFMDVK